MAVAATREELHRLVDELPDSEVIPAARFLEYLWFRRPAQAGAFGGTNKQERFRYPTVDVPWEHVWALVGALPDVPGGDALDDTEALYDEV